VLTLAYEIKYVLILCITIGKMRIEQFLIILYIFVVMLCNMYSNIALATILAILLLVENMS
jgi:hypothetical protein